MSLAIPGDVRLLKFDSAPISTTPLKLTMLGADLYRAENGDISRTVITFRDVTTGNLVYQEYDASGKAALKITDLGGGRYEVSVGGQVAGIQEGFNPLSPENLRRNFGVPVRGSFNNPERLGGKLSDAGDFLVDEEIRSQLAEAFPDVDPSEVTYAMIDDEGPNFYATGGVPTNVMAGPPELLDFQTLVGLDAEFSMAWVDDDGVPLEAMGIVQTDTEYVRTFIERESDGSYNIFVRAGTDVYELTGGYLSGVDGELGIRITGLDSINGAPATNGRIVLAALEGFDFGELLRGQGIGEFNQLVTAADATDGDGFRAVDASGMGSGGSPAWYDTAEAHRYGSLLTGVQSLIAAFQSGKPLPIATSFFNLAASAADTNSGLGDIAQGLNAVSALNSFRAAFERGDELAAAAAGASFARYALQGAQTLVGNQIISQYGSIAGARFAIDAGDEVAAQMVGQFDSLGQVAGSLAQAVPYLNLFVALKNGDEVGVVTAGLAILEAMGYAWAGPVGWAIAIVQIIIIIFDEVEIEGDAHYASTGDGTTVAAVLTHEGDDGGGQQIMSAMESLLAGLHSFVNDQFPEHDRALIAQRLPWLHFDGDEDGGGFFKMVWSDRETSQTHWRRFTVEGDYVASSDHAEIANDVNFFRSMGQQFLEVALGDMQGEGAVATDWEARTAHAQAQRADPHAGFTTLQRAAATGQLLAADAGNAQPGNPGGNSDASQQTARPIVLDLDGNGISVTGRAAGGSVLIDIDDDGFVEETDWINPRDGILVLDRNGDGQHWAGPQASAGERLVAGVLMVEDLIQITFVHGLSASLARIKVISLCPHRRSV